MAVAADVARAAATGSDRTGRAGLAVTGLSVALTFTVALLGESAMEPGLAGPAGQPPWSLGGHPSAYLVIALTGAAIAAGATGLALTLRACRRGWSVPPGVVLAAGIICAGALALVPPFGSSDHLSYAAYGRMVMTGHDPYTTAPAALARLGDPVARAVQDWRSSPSDYGSLATAGQALASAIGGTSVRLTVFVLSLLNAAAFAVTGLLVHLLARGDRRRQLRAALLWTANPLLLQVLVAGAHVDSQAIVFGVAAIAVFALPIRRAAGRPGVAALLLAGAGAGALVGLGFAVKVTTALVGVGLAIACAWAWRARRLEPARLEPARLEPARLAAEPALPGRWGPAWLLGGMAIGFCVLAGASLAWWGPGSLLPALRAGSYTSIGSPWRAVRAALSLAIGESSAEDLVKAGAIALALVLLVALLRSTRGGGLAGTSGALAGLDGIAVWAAFAVVFAWLVAWPYVLPWYDGLGWALLALLPASRLDWLLLARTTALAVGYLPARVIALPAGLGWLRAVVRAGVTPLVLLVVTVTLVVLLWRRRRSLLSPR